MVLLVPLLAFAQHAPHAQPFQRLDRCVYKPQRWDDGDSFHVILPDQKELIFRLYFVDTPEEERVYADRIGASANNVADGPTNSQLVPFHLTVLVSFLEMPRKKFQRQ
jgi:endonuclease YncB( thermonuclease family)